MSPVPLAHRVRGEQIPVNGVHLRLLEVIMDEDQTPFWKARCLQTGKCLTIALDGFVQVPTSPVATQTPQEELDYITHYKRQRRARRIRFILLSIILAAIAFYFRESLSTSWPILRDLVLSVLPR